MASVLDQLTKKIEALGEGQIYEYQNSEHITNSLTITNPKEYKDFFILEDLGIQKALKSVVVETRNSLCTIYYILDSAVLSLPLEMDFQAIELIKEVPLSLISYLRILCSKKAEITIEILDDKLLIHLEDTVVKDKEAPKIKLKRGEKREPVVGKRYTLELLLIEADVLDKEVLEYISNKTGGVYGKITEKFPTRINLDSFDKPENELPLMYYELKNEKGSFKVVYGTDSGVWYIECPTEIARNFSSESEVESLQCSEDILYTEDRS